MLLRAIFGVILSSACLIFLYKPTIWSNKRKLLIIGVLSAIDNVEQRHAIRTTWGRLLDFDKAELKFIVGTNACQVPVVDRVTPYTCQIWKPQVLKRDHELASVFESNTSNLDSTADIRVSGYTFIVRQNITIVQLSVCNNLVTSTNSIVRVLLYDSFSGKVIVSATFAYSPHTLNGTSVPKILSKRTIPTKLEASFEGELRIISDNFDSVCFGSLIWPSAIHILEVIDQKGNYIKSSTAFPFTVASSLFYRIHNADFWIQHDNVRTARELKWSKKCFAVENELKMEREIHRDIYLVDVIDVYSSLQNKTVNFFHWVSSQNYDYVLKTDDDVFVDVVKVIKQLELENNWDWWSCFKVGWSPPSAGKWRDRISSLEMYPPFPSGSGYIMKTSSLKKALASLESRENSLGEDVFVGLMASEAKFDKLNESLCYWTCNEECNVKPCNAPELSPSLMKKMWTLYNDCKEICDCTK